MTKYNNWHEWKYVELHTEQEYLSEDVEYRLDELTAIFEKLQTIAENKGLENCYLKFTSTMEPYEDYLGPVAITSCGYRKVNEKEKEEAAFEEEIDTLAKEMGILPYQARIVLQLKKEGKL